MTEFNKEVADKTTGQKGYQFAAIHGRPGIVAVSIHPGGATRHYCVRHQRIFGMKENCPECEAAGEEE